MLGQLVTAPAGADSAGQPVWTRYLPADGAVTRQRIALARRVRITVAAAGPGRRSCGDLRHRCGLGEGAVRGALAVCFRRSGGRGFLPLDRGEPS